MITTDFSDQLLALFTGAGCRAWTAALATVLLLAGCALPAMPSADMDDPAVSPSFRVGLVTDIGRINDRSFNQSAWEGVLAAAETLGLTEGEGFKFIETTDPKDYVDNLGQFIDNGFDVIVSVGYALGDATLEAALEHPDTHFIGVDQFQVQSLPNLAGLVFREDQAGFLAGMLAAGLSRTGTIAAVLGTDLIPPVVAFGEGFVLGARYVNPEIEVIAAYHPGDLSIAFNDPEWGAATARQALDQGADVVFGGGGNTGNGAVQEVATDPGAGTSVFCIGVDTDQWHTVPAARPCLVSSAMKLITTGVNELIVAAHEGTFPSGNHFGGVGLAGFHDHAHVVGSELRQELLVAKAAFDEGTLETGYGQ